MAAFNEDARFWANGIVPYEPNPTHPFWNTIVAAMRNFHAETVIRFVESTADGERHIRFTFKPTGNETKGDVVNIDKKDRNAHELGHVVGLLHEHQRSDRDEHVKIIAENLERNVDGSLTSDADKQVLRTKPMGEHTDYDIDSLMHYWYTAFSAGGNLRTITYLARPNYKFDTPDELAASDVDLINKVYKTGIARVSFSYEKRVTDTEHRGPIGMWYVDTDPVYCPEGSIFAGLQLTKRGNSLSPRLFSRRPQSDGGRWATTSDEQPRTTSEKRLRQYNLDTRPVICPDGLVIKGFAFQVSGGRVSPKLWCTTPEGADGRWVGGGACDASDGGSFIGQHVDTNKVKAPSRLDATGVALWTRRNRVAPMIYHRV